MANVSQQIPNFLGGVSQASDIQKQVNEVDDITNGFPDVTFGLIKRPGTQLLYNLDIDDPEEYKWFAVQDEALPYFGCIGKGEIYLWESINGTPQTITNNLVDYVDTAVDGNGVDVPAHKQFKVIQLEKGIIIINNRITAALDPEVRPGTVTEKVTRFEDLPTENQTGVYQILNTGIADDDYFVEYREGAWVEVPEPGIEYKLDVTTLPHGLVQVSPGQWIAGPLAYGERRCGNDDTNPIPSFVGQQINNAFGYLNRIGFLAGSNVILSRPLIPDNDSVGQTNPINFFAQSAFTVTDADPIDVNASSIRNIRLRAALPARQGLVLFANREQFLMYSDEGILTPTTTNIRSLCSWEMDPNIEPVELDSEFFFTSGLAPFNQHSRLMKMITRGLEEDPIVTDVSKVVSEWIPSRVYQLASSSQDQFVTILEEDSNELYIYRYFKVDGEVMMKAWTKWEFPIIDKVVAHIVLNGNIYFIGTVGSSTYTFFCQLSESVSNSVLSNSDVNQASPFLPIRPNMDMYARVESAEVVNGKTQLTMAEGYPAITSGDPFLLFAENDIPRSIQYANIQAGYGVPLTYNTSAGKYETENRGDLTANVDKMVMGFLYRFDVSMPTLYFRQEGLTDYAARLNIARCKFECSAGLQGAFSFEVRGDGYEDFDVTYEVTAADNYDADDLPLVATRVFEVPINRLNKYYTLKAISDSPFPLAMNSMTWEGQYSPRFYRRL